MEKQTFKLKADQPYIQLNNLLQVLQLAQTGGHAKLIIQNGEVLVNGQVETRVRKKIVISDEVQLDGNLILIE